MHVLTQITFFVIYICYLVPGQCTACLKKVVHMEMRHFDLQQFNILHSILYDLKDY